MNKKNVVRMVTTSTKNSENGSHLSGAGNEETGAANNSESPKNITVSDARPERGSSDPVVAKGGAIQHILIEGDVYGNSPDRIRSETAEQSLCRFKGINSVICSHPESRRLAGVA